MKKVLAIILALVMALGLAACGGQQAASGETSSSKEETPAASESTAPESTASESEASESESEAVVSEEPITLTIGLVQKVNVESYEDNEFTNWLEEQTGYNIEFEYFSSDHSEAITQITAMMAGGEKLPDIFWGINGFDNMRSEWGRDGYLIDLTPYLEDRTKSATFWSRAEEVMTEEQIKNMMGKAQDPTDGAYYVLPSYQVTGPDKQSTQCYINKQWLENLNLEMPTNYEELVEVLRAFRDGDPNGNGKKDELPMVGGVGLYRADIVQWLINNWIYCNDANADGIAYLFSCEDGTLYYPYTTEEYRNALREIKKLVDEGLLSTMTWTVSQTSELKALVTPEDGVAIAGVVGCHSSVHIATDSPILYEMAPLAPFNYAPLMEDNQRYSAAITEDCENPDAAFALLDFMYSEEAGLRMRYGVPDVDWEYNEDDDGNTGMLVLNSDAYSGQTRQTWSFVDATIVDFQHFPNKTIRAKGSEPTWTNDRSTMAMEHFTNYLAVGEENNPKEVIYTPAYNAEEIEENGDIFTNLLSYIDSTRAEFLNGVRDLDTDWDQYVSEFESIGANILLENAQAAYDRQK